MPPSENDARLLAAAGADDTAAIRSALAAGAEP
jgi:hypothetical protein